MPFSLTNRFLSTSALVLSTALASGSPSWANDPIEPALAEAKEKHGVDVKKVFGTQCGLCHGSYGMVMGGRGGGPKLAGTAMTREQVIQRITEGKQGMMPPFKKALKGEEIEALATYIKALPGK